MEDKTILVHVPLTSFEDGICAMARIEALKALTIRSEYSISREDIACILGFKLPEKAGKDE
nr:hypothetical protein [uncultured Clostridium sp.]